MSKGAYAKGTLPGVAELMRGKELSEMDKAYWAREGLIERQQEEIQRLRSALVACEQALRILHKYEQEPSNLYEVYKQVDEALSSSPDTGDTRSALEEAIEEIEEEMCDDFSPRAQRINMNLERIRECLGITITGMEEPEDG